MIKKLFISLNILSCLCIIGLTSKILIAPIIALSLWEEEYKEMVFICDNVMRDHLVAKNRVIVKVNDENIKQLKASELGLISCHDYDKLRKKLQIWGINEDRLALIGLASIEENAKNVRRFVEIHEFNY